MFKRLICRSEVSSHPSNIQPYGFLKSWKAMALASAAVTLNWMGGLRADVEPMPRNNSPIQLASPNSSILISPESSSIELIKGKPLETPEPGRLLAPPAERALRDDLQEADASQGADSGSQSESNAARRIPAVSDSREPTFLLRTATRSRKRRKSKLPSLESLIGSSNEVEQIKVDDDAPSSLREVKRDPYFEAIVEKAKAEELQRTEQQRIEQERLAEEQRIEQERLAEEQRQAAAQAKILELPAELLEVPAPEVKPFIPIPRVVSHTKVVTKYVADWLVMKDGLNPVLGSNEVRRLLSRSRLEVAAGDLMMAHTFAEAAAEVDIPLELFKEIPQLILAEIEYVSTRRVAKSKNTLVAYDETVEKKNDKTYVKQLQENLRGFRAISEDAISIKPPVRNSSNDVLQVPSQQARLRMAQLPVIFQDTGFGRGWSSMSYSWEAPAVKYAPLYFEQPELERYGNEYCYGLQPIVSGLDFFLSVPTLPYQMGIEGNSMCAEVYDLGYARPGTCVPSSIYTLPFSWTGLLSQAGATTGLVFILP